MPLETGATLRRTCPFLLEMRNVPHMQQVQAVKYVSDRLPRFAGAASDAGCNGSFVAEAVREAYGGIVHQVKPTESWYRENMPPYKAAFEDDMVRIPRHEDVLEDHRAVRLVRGVPRPPAARRSTRRRARDQKNAKDPT